MLLMLSTLSAKLEHVPASADFLKKNIKIIDIRTPAEWKETGVIKGSYQIMFFDEKGEFNIELFLTQLKMLVKKDEKFAIICRTGARTHMVGEFLANKQGYDVINLKGGLMRMLMSGYKTIPYKK